MREGRGRGRIINNPEVVVEVVVVWVGPMTAPWLLGCCATGAAG